ncbi:MAG: helix-turn-helix domain-containing protein [Chitinophagaceae bacterium]
MKQFVLQQGTSPELRSFPDIIEIGSKKNISIHLGSMPVLAQEFLRVYCVLEGKFEWQLQGQRFVVYPGDTVLVLPNQVFGSTKGYLEIGTIAWLYLNVTRRENGNLCWGAWSNLTENERQTISNIMLLSRTVVPSRVEETVRILRALQNELFNHEIGFHTRIRHLLDELLVLVTRQLTKQSHSGRDFPKIFLQLEQRLRENLFHQWSVEEMAATVGMGTTHFNERVKTFTGFTPTNYLINIRISESIKLLRKPELTLTDIALDTGFYSSQHFSTTFKKLTGYTPSEFRKKGSADS